MIFSWRRGGIVLLSSAGLACSTSSSSSSPAVSVAQEAPCAEASRAVRSRLADLRSEGHIADALALAPPSGCPRAEQELLADKLPLWMRVGDRTAAATAIQQLQGSASAELKALAAEAQANLPPERDPWSLAEQARTQATHRTGASRQAALDTAMLAMERGSMAQVQPVALVGKYLQHAGGNRFAALALALPDETLHEVMILPTGENLGWEAVRLLPAISPVDCGSSCAIGSTVMPSRANGKGEIVLSSAGGVGYLARNDHLPALRLPQGGIHTAMAGGKVIVYSTTSVRLLDGKGQDLMQPEEVLSSSPAPSLTNSSNESPDGNTWVLCPRGEQTDQVQSVVIVDVPSSAVILHIRGDLRCDVDAVSGHLAVLQRRKDKASAELQIWGLDGKSRWRKNIPNTKAIPLNWPKTVLGIGERVPSPYPTKAGPRLVAVFPGENERDGLYFDADTGASLTNPFHHRPAIGPRALQNVPLIYASSDSVPVELAALAPPPRKLLPAFFKDVPRSSVSNGAMSKDGKLVAAFTTDRGGGDVQLAVASANDLRVFRTFPVNRSSNMSFFFLNEHLLLATIGNIDQVFDINTGHIVAQFPSELDTPQEEDGVLVLDDLAWSLDHPGINPIKTGLPRNASVQRSPTHVSISSEGTTVSFESNRVMIDGPAPPPWLMCRFGEFLAPWELCRSRFEKRRDLPRDGAPKGQSHPGPGSSWIRGSAPPSPPPAPRTCWHRQRPRPRERPGVAEARREQAVQRRAGETAVDDGSP